METNGKLFPFVEGQVIGKGDPVFSKEGLGLAVLNSFSGKARNINFVRDFCMGQIALNIINIRLDRNHNFVSFVVSAIVH